jgi:hypothetical protein
VGITAKIWPATDEEIRACREDPAKASAMFHRHSSFSDDPAYARGHALIHGAHALRSAVVGFAEAGLGVHSIEGASDPTYTMSAARVRALHAEAANDPCRALLTRFPTQAIHRVEIADVVTLAESTGRGIILCVFEDW